LVLERFQPKVAQIAPTVDGREMGFQIRLQIPEVQCVNHILLQHVVNTALSGNVPEELRTAKLIATFVRLVVAAIEGYENGRLSITHYFNSDGPLKVSAIFVCAAEYEMCLTNMHRAIRCMKAIRGRAFVSRDVKETFHSSPGFVHQRVADRIEGVRNAVQHIEGDICAGRHPEQSAFALVPEGDEIHENGDIIKVFDRLQIGDEKLPFSDIAAWLRQMAECAERLSKYERSIKSTVTTAASPDTHQAQGG
jgi:hypothetical protein